MKALFSRLSEPSSWGGIAVLLGLVGVHVSNETFQTIATAGSALAGAAAYFIPEKKK
jgi:hypothetical protein